MVEVTSMKVRASNALFKVISMKVPTMIDDGRSDFDAGPSFKRAGQSDFDEGRSFKRAGRSDFDEGSTIINDARVTREQLSPSGELVQANWARISIIVPAGLIIMPKARPTSRTSARSSLQRRAGRRPRQRVRCSGPTDNVRVVYLRHLRLFPATRVFNLPYTPHWCSPRPRRCWQSSRTLG